jgi:tetratricopeptide (TPR) repeat protein
MSTAVFGRDVRCSSASGPTVWFARRFLSGFFVAALFSMLMAAPAVVRADDEDEGQKIFNSMKFCTVSIFNSEGSGTGVLLNTDGLILTCAHVVTSPIPYEVKVDIGTPDEPKVVTFKKVQIIGYHPERDLAEIKIDPKENNCKLVACTVSKEKASSGQRIYAIGDPGAGDKVLEKTITQGIISGVDREFAQQKFYQIDAAVNPGNSGGPVVDHNGKVIGIVTFQFNNLQALNFAIPLKDVDLTKFGPLTDHKADPARSAELLKEAKAFSAAAAQAKSEQGEESEAFKKYSYYAFYCYSESLIYDPSNPEIYTDIGTQYIQLGLDESAAAYLVRAVEIRPWGVNNAVTYNNLGFAYSRQKLDDKAVAAWKEGQAKFPYTASLWDHLAQYSMDKELYPDAAYDASVALACGGSRNRVTALQRLLRDARAKLDDDEKAELTKKIDHDSIAEALDKMRIKSNKARKRRSLYMTTAFVDLMKEVGTMDVPGVEDKISQVPLKAPDNLAIGEDVADAGSDADPDAPKPKKKKPAVAEGDGGDDDVPPPPVPHKRAIPAPPDGGDDGGDDTPQPPRKHKKADPGDDDPGMVDPADGGGDEMDPPAPHKKKAAKPEDSDGGYPDPDPAPKNKAKAADPKGGDDWIGGAKKGDPKAGGSDGADDDKPVAPSTVVAPIPAITGLDLAGKVQTVDDARVAPIDVDGQEISDAVLAGDGAFVYVLQKNGMLRKVSLPTLKEERQTNLGAGVVAMGMSHKGLAVYMSTAQEIWLLDASTLEVKHRTHVAGVVKMSAAVGTTDLLVSTGPTNLELVDPVTEKVITKLTPDSAGAGPDLSFAIFALSPDGQNIFASQGGAIAEFSLAAGKIAYVATGPKLGPDATSIIVSPDSRYVCMPCKSGNLPVAGETKKDAVTYVFKISDLQKPVMTINSGASPSTLAFDVPARQIYAQNNLRQLIVYSPSGEKIKDYTLVKDKNSDNIKFLVHPDGRSLMVLVGGTLQWVTLP